MGIGQLYCRTVRSLLPRVQSNYSGIQVLADQRIGERFAERLTGRKLPGTDNPEYEVGLAEGLRTFVRPGDKVVVIGGGIGVTAAIAVQMAGSTGSVICFEGGAEQVSAVRNTAKLNDLVIDVRHAFVGQHDNVYGTTDGAVEVAISDLPDCDVLEMDCEGAELEIILTMSIRPRDILVEAHGVCGSSTRDVRAALVAIGYTVEDRLRLPDRASSLRYYEESDIFVLFAHQNARM